MAAIIQKNIGSPRTISTVQKVREIVSVALSLSRAGSYAVTVSYQETEADGDGAKVGQTLSLVKVIDDGALPNAAKTEIDNIYSRVLNAL